MDFNKYAHDIGTIELMRHSYNKAIQDAYTAIAAYALAKDQQIDKTTAVPQLFRTAQAEDSQWVPSS